jgi:hypothetical protein
MAHIKRNFLGNLMALAIISVVFLSLVGIYQCVTKPAVVATAVTAKSGVSLTTTFRTAGAPELHVAARQQGPFNIGIASFGTPDHNEYTYIGVNYMANVRPVANATCYRVRILVPDERQRPKAAFEATVDYDPSLKQFVFR